MRCATVDGATEAVEALAEVFCFRDRHRHTATRPACAPSRRAADVILCLLAISRSRALAVGGWLSDQGIASIGRDIERAEVMGPGR